MKGGGGGGVRARSMMMLIQDRALDFIYHSLCELSLYHVKAMGMRLRLGDIQRNLKWVGYI